MSPFRVSIALALLAVSCQSFEGVPYPPPTELESAREFVLEHYTTPIEYVVKTFEDHDLVFLGEFHRIRHDPVLVQNLIPALYRAGVTNLATEFANYEDQGLIDRLITEPAYDEALARTICLRSFLSIGLGGYQEYSDIFRAAWRVNRALPEGLPRFRVIGVNNSNDWSVLKDEKDAQDPNLVAQAFRGQSEADWAQRVMDEVVSKNQKVLIYAGMHHAFTQYRQPVVDAGRFVRFAQGRFGNALFDQLGKRTFTIFLHSPWYPKSGYDAEQLRLACDGMMDYLLATLPADRRNFGCDLADTPLGRFTGETSLYSSGYENFQLSDFCDGYICQGWLTDYQPVTPISGFINSGNLEFARTHFPNPRFRSATAATLNRAIAEDAGVYRRVFRQGLQDASRIYALPKNVLRKER